MVYFNVVKILPLLLLNTVLCEFVNSATISIPDPNEKEHMKFQDLCLGLSNLFRAFYGAPPLEWDDTLAESSKAWANYLNSIQTMEHSTSKFGENLYAIENPANIDHICEYAMVAWFREKKDYDFNNPKFSEKTGHFSQMMWKSSKRIGIGESGSATGKFYIVASYYPPGNTDGGFEENVLPQRKLNMNCLSHFGSPETFKVLRREFHGGPGSELYFYNSSEPCNLNETTGETTGDNKENHGSEGTQSQTGSKGGTGGRKGTNSSSAKPATQKHSVQLVFVPIAESAGNTQQPLPLIFMAPPSGVVAPVQQPVASAVPAPSSTVQSNAGSPGTSSTSSKATPTAQTAMNPVRATKAFDPTPNKRSKLLKILGSFRRQ